MNILFIGDPHIQPSNVTEIDKLEKSLESIIEKYQPEIIIVGGDILHEHERLHTLAMNRAISFIKYLSNFVKVYCLVGNHDLINNQQFLSKNHWMTHLEHLKNVTVVESAQEISINDKKIVMVPYVYPGRFEEAIKVSDIDYEDAMCIFAHQEFKGCKMGAIVSEIGDKWNEENPLVVSGHIHDNQRPQKNIYYPGTPLQHSFGDSGKNIVAIIDISGENPRIIEEETGCASKKTVSTTLEKIENINLEKYEGTQLRIAISGDATSLKVFQKSAKFKELQKAGVKVALKPIASEIEELTKENLEDTSDFIKILEQLIREENNKMLYSDYQDIILGYGDDDVLVL